MYTATVGLLQYINMPQQTSDLYNKYNTSDTKHVHSARCTMFTSYKSYYSAIANNYHLLTASSIQ